MKIINIFSLAFSSQEFKTRLIFIMIYLTIITLLIDTSVDQIYYLNINEYPLNVKVILFMIIAVIALIGQYAFLHFVGKKGIDIRKTDILNIGTLLKIAHVVQSVLTILFLIVIFQMIFEIQYNVIMLILPIGVSTLFGGLMMIFLLQSFFHGFVLTRILSYFPTAYHLLLLHQYSYHSCYCNRFVTNKA
jgi:hypothetical protein